MTPSEVERPRIIDLTPRVDDRGWLVEGAHNYDLPDSKLPPGSRWASENLAVPPRFGQVYLVHSRVRGTVRGFHRHRILWDLFQIATGAAKFVVWSGRFLGHNDPRSIGGIKESLCLKDGRIVEVNELIEVVLSVEAPKLLIVPPFWYHGWVALEDKTSVVSIGSELYDSEKPDEERVPWDVLGPERWQVHNQ